MFLQNYGMIVFRVVVYFTGAREFLIETDDD